MEDNTYFDESFSLIQKVSILLLSANNFEGVRGKLWFQKELFLITENMPKLKEEAIFEEDLLGPYSETSDVELKQLQIEGIVSKKKLELTSLGKNIAERLQSKVKVNVLKMISDMKTFLNDLTEDELLGFIYFSYPDMRIESIKFKEIEERRQPIAVGLYRKKKIGLGKASKIAGLSQEEFIEKLRDSDIIVYSE